MVLAMNGEAKPPKRVWLVFRDHNEIVVVSVCETIREAESVAKELRRSSLLEYRIVGPYVLQRGAR